MAKYLENHRKIRKKLKDFITENQCVCVSTRTLANKLEMDPRTVKNHLKIMEEYDEGIFVDSNKRIFCDGDSLKKVYNAIELKRTNKSKHGD